MARKAASIATKRKHVERRKPDDLRKDEMLRVRVRAAHLKEFEVAAEAAGIQLAPWVIERLLRCAREEKAARDRLSTK